MRLRQLPFCLVLVLGCLCSAQDLTEREAMQRFIQSSPRLQAWDAEVRAKRAEWLGQTLFPNASMTLSQEDSGGVRDQFLTVSQPLPLSGRLGLLRNAGRASTSASEASIARRRQIALADFRRVFSGFATAQQRVTVLRQNVERLQELLRILREREKEGEGAGFDVLRSERELADAEADWKLSGVELERKRYELIGMMHGNVTADLRARSETIGIASLESADALSQAAQGRRPDLRALQSQSQSLYWQQQAAARQWDS
jgi:outer membrane protein, heavy metal efflux system